MRVAALGFFNTNGQALRRKEQQIVMNVFVLEVKSQQKFKFDCEYSVEGREISRVSFCREWTVPLQEETVTES